MNIDDLLNRSVEEIIVRESLEKKLKSGKKLRIKFGIDPTAADLHLGHTVPLRKLKQFQDAGHQVVLIIGDYTATIGDPSARKEARKILSKDEVKDNMKTYLDQIGKILDLEKTEVHQNSEWYDKKDTLFLFELASKGSMQQMLQRDDFQKRVTEGKDVSVLETLYPLLQGYDSVCVKADLEIGGTDQKFNLLMGRKIQRAYGQESQDIIMLPLLEGTDGTRKMSKSFGNYIGINEAPSKMYGKVMSIPDSLILTYYELVTDITTEGLNVVKKELAEGKNPRDIKAKLAYLIVEEYHSAEKAEEAQAEFDKIFKNKELPSNIKTATKPADMRLDDLLVFLEMADSKSEARRLIEQGAVDIDGQKQTDPYKIITSDTYSANGTIIKAGPQNIIKVK